MIFLFFPPLVCPHCFHPCYMYENLVIGSPSRFLAKILARFLMVLLARFLTRVFLVRKYSVQVYWDEENYRKPELSNTFFFFFFFFPPLSLSFSLVFEGVLTGARGYMYENLVKVFKKTLINHAGQSYVRGSDVLSASTAANLCLLKDGYGLLKWSALYFFEVFLRFLLDLCWLL